ncbi:hypothetical protein NC981_16220 [Leptolyngbya sp. DQ-M1]|uniref:hypothetical protein n=1 Tax=Leptolyngbya sp. DQ-M1 TaxID=2933920 RepID=UPI0032997AE2
MNALWFHVLRTIYRKEPISAFILTAGMMNVAIGGIDHSTSLAVFGFSTVTIALILRWWSLSRRPEPIRVTPSARSGQVPVRALPETSSARSLPPLSMPKKPR